MLLATALCGVLLAALWTLMSTYGELFDKGQRQVEQAQLGRALLQQFADDLRTAIQDPIPGSPGEARGAAQRRRFGLFGSSQELRFDVLQVTPQQAHPIPVGQTTELPSEQPAARVPELRTVHYSFTQPSVSGDLSDQRLPGLVRRELDFETPLDSVAESGPSAESPASREAEFAGIRGDADGGGRAATRILGNSATVAPEPPVDDPSLWVPEVVSLQLSYFDGHAWTGSWNSLERKSLPAAVTIQLQLADPPRAARAGLTQRTAGDSTEDTAESDAGSELSVRSGPSAAYRLIVDLPGSPNYRPPAVKPEPSLRQPVRPPVRRIAPPRWSRPAEPPPLPEDWIRTGSR
jgi:hypothetical protein